MNKIMVVDDDPDILFSIKNGLEIESNKYKVFSAKSGKEFFNFLKNNEIPDLILLDIMMPEMSGWEVYDCLHKNTEWENISIIFLSARSDTVAKKTGKFLGDDYIEKPVVIDELIKRIEKVLKKKIKKNTNLNIS
jgi:DNA-binding response OmpR family regulator